MSAVLRQRYFGLDTVSVAALAASREKHHWLHSSGAEAGEAISNDPYKGRAPQLMSGDGDQQVLKLHICRLHAGRQRAWEEI